MIEEVIGFSAAGILALLLGLTCGVLTARALRTGISSGLWWLVEKDEQKAKYYLATGILLILTVAGFSLAALSAVIVQFRLFGRL